MPDTLSLSIAPMMERTDRHFRYLMRLVSPNARLYTEMITSAALLHGDAARLLAYDPAEHPLAIQLGGADPAALARAAKLAADAGYDEINLNVGCPSGRVQAGEFGARLMLEPDRVADCVVAMREATSLPVTVKTRIGVDEHDDYAVLQTLTQRVVDAGVSRLIVHARKAWLKGLSPKQNREVPPLDYPRVWRLKREFPALPIEINGGFTSEADVLAQRGLVDGVMLGRSAYSDPLLIGRLDALLFGGEVSAVATGGEASTSALAGAIGGDASAAAIVAAFADYLRREQAKGTPLKSMTRHLLGLVTHRPGARRWRQRLSAPDEGADVVGELLAELAGMREGTRYNAGCAGPAAVRAATRF